MKLSLLTYNCAREWDLDTIIEVARRWGYAAIEFRAEADHKHGVELELDAAARAAVRRKLEGDYLVASCIGTSSRFESADSTARQQQIDRTKRYVELARDIDCDRLRVFGNDIPDGVDSRDCVRYVGDTLRTLGEFAAPYDVEVNLEMHGQFRFWRYTVGAVEHAGQPNIGIVYNCEPSDVIAGSVEETYSHVRDYIRHVHMHDFTSGYPYGPFLRLLRDDGYEGYCSSEIGGSPDPERVLAYFALLYREYLRI
ncbi:MAG: hypothetical protein CL878_14190 [Dehalococcoidia bacterium]|nr:hypothetical protein [Dehalococcoidia bacterium]